MLPRGPGFPVRCFSVRALPCPLPRSRWGRARTAEGHRRSSVATPSAARLVCTSIQTYSFFNRNAVKPATLQMSSEWRSIVSHRIWGQRALAWTVRLDPELAGVDCCRQPAGVFARPSPSRCAAFSFLRRWAPASGFPAVPGAEGPTFCPPDSMLAAARKEPALDRRGITPSPGAGCCWKEAI